MLGAASAARAAEVTDLPPPRGAVAGLVWDGSQLSGGLAEGGQRVGERRIFRQAVTLGAELAPLDGLALTIDLAFVPTYTFSFPAARTMVVDPLSGLGVYGQTDPGPTVEVQANGFAGAWIGLAAAPVAERYASPSRLDARLDVAVRTPRPHQNLWTTEGGDRSPSPGGWALRLAAAFATDRGASSPYLRTEYTHELPVAVDVVDEGGVAWADQLAVRPARTFVADGGVEVDAFSRPDGTRVAADGWIGAGYRSWEDVASGVYLPNVLDTGRLVPVTTGDTILARAGLAADVHVRNLVRARAGATLGWTIPYQLEHLYAVQTTPDTLEVGWFVEVRGVLQVPQR